jgi:subtilase family serine protease
MAFEITEPSGSEYEGSGQIGGLSPANLRSAYDLPSSGGSGQTVAIVDAYNDPNAESDLKKYRANYSLSECTESNKCFKKVNQSGVVGSYPANSTEWSIEMSLDLDMVSAICPECHILLVEATSNSYKNLETAENEAATLKATEISDSWGGPERSEETTENSAFDHSGIPIAVASGDGCYINECSGLAVPNFPATSPSVIAVGGTELKKASNSRGWSESVWYESPLVIGTGSGCSSYESKPSWEIGSSCSKRTDNDAAAVGACKSPLSTYDSGWTVECGTSAAAPIVAGVEALSTGEARKDGPSFFPKLASKEEMWVVEEGSNWYEKSCGSYLCKVGLALEGEDAYSGPVGYGTPSLFDMPPEVTTLPATSIGETQATLNARVNPKGAETRYDFEYGTTKALGSLTSEASAGSGESTVEVHKTVTGLKGGTTYYFRVVARNGARHGLSDGSTENFATLAGE